MRTIAPAIAIGTADENVAQKLHLDLLEARAAAPLTLAQAGIKAECAGVQPALLGRIRLGKEFANIIERPDIDGRIRARRLAQDRLIDEQHLAKLFPTCQICTLRNAENAVVAFHSVIVFGPEPGPRSTI